MSYLLVGKFGSVIAEGTQQECEFAKEAMLTYGIPEHNIWGIFPSNQAVLSEDGNVEDIISWQAVISETKQ